MNISGRARTTIGTELLASADVRELQASVRSLYGVGKHSGSNRGLSVQYALRHGTQP